MTMLGSSANAQLTIRSSFVKIYAIFPGRLSCLGVVTCVTGEFSEMLIIYLNIISDLLADRMSLLPGTVLQKV